MLYLDDKRIIPAPIFNLDKQITFFGDGQPLSSRYVLNLRGTILPNKGSPSSSGFYTGASDPANESWATDSDRHYSIQQKQEYLKDLFAKPGLKLQYFGSGNNPVLADLKLNSLSFDQGTWVTRADYTASFEACNVSLNTSSAQDDYSVYATGLHLNSASDNVSIVQRDDGTGLLEISRVITAQGQSYPSGAANFTDPWKNARTWVQRRAADAFPSGDSRFNLPFGTGSYYNYVSEEAINKYDGSYSLTQRYIYGANNYSEVRNVTRSTEYPRNNDGGPILTTINVNGVIQGLDVNNIPTGKLNSARTYYNTIVGGLGAAVGAYGSGINQSYTEDQSNGQIQYSFTFINSTGSLYTHTYDVNFSFAQGPPQVTIAGTIEGISADTFFHLPYSSGNKFNRAASGWVSIEPTLKTLAFAQTTLLGGASATGFSDAPLNKQLTFNEVIGTIQYQYTFGYGNTGNTKYNESYEISITTNNSNVNPLFGGITVQATINGQIVGLVTGSNANSPATKYANAKYGFAQITGLIFTRVSGEITDLGGGISYPLTPSPVARTIGLDSNNGTVSYSYVFTNSPSTSSGVIASQDMEVTDNMGGRVFAIQIIPGRAAGPILQDIATRSERRRNINLSLALYPSGNTFWTFGDLEQIRSLASGIVDDAFPTGTQNSTWFIQNDNDTWNWKNGVYNRQLDIVYRP